MESRVKSLGVAVAAALCAALTAGPGLAQEYAPKAGSDRDAPRTAPFPRLGADGAAARNAIGITVPGGRSPSHDVSAGHAGIGASVPGVSGVAATGNVGGANLHRLAIPLNAVTGPAAHTAGINGTTMGHVGSGPNYIGGPAKDRSGINGTAMRPKH